MTRRRYNLVNGLREPYRYRMANILWKRWIGPGHLGTIHNETFLLQRIEAPIGFRWTLKRRKTGEVWSGNTIQELAEQVFTDLHGEVFDVDEVDYAGEWCPDCNSRAILRAVEG